jgi:hypothetical protein
MDRIDMAQDREQSVAFLNTVLENSSSIKCCETLVAYEEGLSSR